MGQRCDLAVVVGGDGTMLGIARELARWNLPLVGINQGRLGFITDIPLDQYKDALEPMITGDYEVETRSMLQGDVWRDGQRIFEGLSLNDVVVSRGASTSMVELRVDVDGDFVANMRADGLIVATPTGSTAYALSAGGPILHPSIGGWVMVPIASHTLSNRPIVLPDSGEVRIGIVAGQGRVGQLRHAHLASLLHGDQVRVRRSDFTGALPAPAGLELLRHAAAQAALVRRRGLGHAAAPVLRDVVIVAELELELGPRLHRAHR
jgi:NAD+ kinase